MVRSDALYPARLSLIAQMRSVQTSRGERIIRALLKSCSGLPGVCGYLR
jgi:hypothetical protein